jgi:cobalt/nickel transport system ATP-binding protein
MIIQFEDVGFSYPGGKQVLDHLTFELRQGEKAGLMGHNGSGKTTLFHIIMGLARPSSGSVRIFGRPVKQEKDFQGVRQKVGFLFQDSDDQLFSPTVLEDVAFGPLNLGKSPQEAKDISIRVLKDLGLEEFENRITHKLSGGEKRLVALATVLSMEPEVLLLDEPTNGLHPTITEKLIDILNGLEVSFIAVSHHVEFLTRVSTNLYTLKDGRIQEGVEHHCCVGHDHDHHHHADHGPSENALQQ